MFKNIMNKEVAVQTDDILINVGPVDVKDVITQTDYEIKEFVKMNQSLSQINDVASGPNNTVASGPNNTVASEPNNTVNEISEVLPSPTDDNPIIEPTNNMPLIIGITGKKFNGKDTLGKYLSKYGYKRLAFADPLKDVLRDVFHFNDEQLYGEDKEKIDPYWKVSPRTIMQFVGTDLFRHQMKKILPDVGNNIWIEVIKRQILEIWKTNPDQKIVLTDLRFPNEIALIKEFGGIIIRVKRNIDKNDNDFVVVHESETYIDTLNVDYDFDNNGTKDDLFTKFDDLYK